MAQFENIPRFLFEEVRFHTQISACEICIEVAVGRYYKFSLEKHLLLALFRFGVLIPKLIICALLLLQ